MTCISFLGTGNFLAPGRYWNGFVMDGHMLVEASPTSLPHLRRLGIGIEHLDCIVVSHFHPDHTFGWPFLLLEAVQRGRDRPLHVVGPPGVASFFEEMMRLGSVMDVHRDAHEQLDISYLEVDGSWQQAGPLRLRAVEVEHVAELHCVGYLFEREAGVVGYSGDSHPCAGLDELAAGADVLVLECSGVHASKSHMDLESVRSLRNRHPGTPFVLTHLGEGVAGDGLEGVTIPEDFEQLEV